MLTQHSVKKGIEMFGEAGISAVIDILKQLHSREVLELKIRYLMFLKQKNSGQIKGRGCSDGRAQRKYMNKEDTSSPTVAVESLMLSCSIDAE